MSAESIEKYGDNYFNYNHILTSKKYLQLTKLIKKAEKIKTKVDACDGEAWEFISYVDGKVIWKRDLDYIYGIKPLEGIEKIILSMPKEIPNCPNCGSNMIEIIYGMPDPEAVKMVKKGKLFLGGCYIDEKNPVFHCNVCRRSYFPDMVNYINEENNFEDNE